MCHVLLLLPLSTITTDARLPPGPTLARALSPNRECDVAVQTVSASQATEMARPLPKPKQAIDKGKVWAIFVGGAVSLFLCTLAVEGNEEWFPAISRANQAMSVAMVSRAAVRGAVRMLLCVYCVIRKGFCGVRQGRAGSGGGGLVAPRNGAVAAQALLPLMRCGRGGMARGTACWRAHGVRNARIWSNSSRCRCTLLPSLRPPGDGATGGSKQTPRPSSK